MRQIKFRGKNLVNDNWAYGDLLQGRFAEIVNSTEACKVDTETVGQYTGLTDRNGREIYEGDIVEYLGKRRQVVFENHHGSAYFGIVMSRIETWGFGPLDEAYCMEVVGNVHDNPELLQG